MDTTNKNISDLLSNSGLSQNDISLLSNLMNGYAGKKKISNVNPSSINSLTNKLLKSTAPTSEPKTSQKELKDMTEEEKIIYRNELKQKLRNKRNEKIISRTNKSNVNIHTNNTNTPNIADVEKITEMITNISNNLINKQNEAKKKEEKEEDKVEDNEKLDDFIN